MKSPFPGMDPFIEACGLWEDFHGALIQDIKYALTPLVPDRYVVRTGERSYLVLIESEGKAEHSFQPDVSVARRSRKKPSKRGSTMLAERSRTVEPVTMRAFVEEEYRETFVEIYEADPELRLVTSIEVLSPSNKHFGTPSWDIYQRKRQGLLLGAAHLVEIDLLRGGRRMPMLDSWPDSPYALLVARAKHAQQCQIWPAHFQQPIPPIPVPLAKPDPDVELNLQAIIEAIYDRSRYERSIDYKTPLTPRVKGEDAAWIKRLLRQRAAR